MIPRLQEVLPIKRASMRLKIQVPIAGETNLLALLQSKGATVESQDYALRDQVQFHTLLAFSILFFG